ncbi:NAD(P)-binding protein [Agrocybe pediades]|nr:NAD(P)-binding protein [Agrocybe pediades]
MSGVAVVTGASQGIGRAIAVRLAADGFQVVVNDLPSRLSDLKELCMEIGKSGGKAFPVLADVSDEEQVRKMVNDVVEKAGSLDVMVANAGLCITKPFIQSTVEDLRKLSAVNIEGLFHCYKYAAVQMIAQGRGGRIIGAASVASKQAWPMLGLYSATKFAVRGLTQALAMELGQHNITVNAYGPGGVDTQMLQGIYSTLEHDNLRVDPAVAAQRKQVLPRVITPEDIAGLVSYLASKDAAMVTGQTMSINAGLYCD